MSVATAGELRCILLVSTTSPVVHHPDCPRARGFRHSPVVQLGSDERYWRDELRPGKCCAPVVPRPDAPPDVPGWNHALRI